MLLKILAIITTIQGQLVAIGEIGDGSWKVPFKTENACAVALAEKTVTLGMIMRAQTGNAVNVKLECMDADEADKRYKEMEDKIDKMRHA